MFDPRKMKDFMNPANMKKLEQTMKTMQGLMSGDPQALWKALMQALSQEPFHTKLDLLIEPVKHRGRERLGIFLSVIEEEEEPAETSSTTD